MIFIKNDHCAIPDRYLISVRINHLRNSVLKRGIQNVCKNQHLLFSVSKLKNVTTYCIWKKWNVNRLLDNKTLHLPWRFTVPQKPGGRKPSNVLPKCKETSQIIKSNVKCWENICGGWGEVPFPVYSYLSHFLHFYFSSIALKELKDTPAPTYHRSISIEKDP